MRGAIPEVLRLMGDAAHVDRVNVMLARRGPQDEPLLVVVSEWTAEGVPPHIDDPSRLYVRRASVLGSVC